MSDIPLDELRIHRQRLERTVRALHGFSSRIEVIEKRCERLQSDAAKAKHRVGLREEVEAAIETMRKAVHERVIGQFEKLLSAIVADVITDEDGSGAREVRLSLETFRSLPALDILVTNKGEHEKVQYNGGAMANVVSTGLHYVALAKTKNRKFLVLDEADCWIEPHRIHKYLAIIAMMAKSRGVQTIFISHFPPSFFHQHAEQIVRLSRGIDPDGKDCALAQVVSYEGQDDDDGSPCFSETLPQPWDDLDRGIRQIRLKGFLSHLDTTIPLAKNLTAIVGPNNVGKSIAVTLALKAVAYGDSDDAMIRHNQTEAIIQIGVEEGRTVEWRRTRKSGEKKVRYRLLDATGQIEREAFQGKDGVPDFVTEALGLQLVDGIDVHMTDQLKQVFMLNENATQRAKLLSLGAGAERIHRISQTYKEMLQEDSSLVRSAEKKLFEITRAFDALKDISDPNEIAHLFDGDPEQGLIKILATTVERELASLDEVIARAQERAHAKAMLAQLRLTSKAMQSIPDDAELQQIAPQATPPLSAYRQLSQQASRLYSMERMKQLAADHETLVLPAQQSLCPHFSETAKQVLRTREIGNGLRAIGHLREFILSPLPSPLPLQAKPESLRELSRLRERAQAAGMESLLHSINLVTTEKIDDQHQRNHQHLSNYRSIIDEGRKTRSEQTSANAELTQAIATIDSLKEILGTCPLCGTNFPNTHREHS